MNKVFNAFLDFLEVLTDAIEEQERRAPRPRPAGFQIPPSARPPKSRTRKKVSCPPPVSWRRTLGIRKATVATPDLIEHKFRVLAKRHHPDMGGQPGKFEQLMRARQAAHREIG